MAARAMDLTSHAITMPFTVDAASTATKGKGVKFGAADNLIIDDTAGDAGFAIALETGVAGAVVQVALLGYAVVPVLVGTGGATRGAYAISTSDGFTNQTMGGGNTLRNIAGRFMQTGVLGDMVGLLLGNFAAGSA